MYKRLSSVWKFLIFPNTSVNFPPNMRQSSDLNPGESLGDVLEKAVHSDPLSHCECFWSGSELEEMETGHCG